MAKKKTKEVNTEKQVETINDSTQSNIGYQGNVEVRLVKNGKRISGFRKHNVGTNELFEFITACFAGTYDSNKVPKYIKMFHSTGTLSPSNLGNNALLGDSSVATTDVQQSEHTNDDGTKNKSVTYKFIVPASMINTNVISGSNTINTIAIYNSTNMNVQTSPSAYLSIPSDYQISDTDLGAGVNIIILWEMIFSNK